MCNTTVVIVVIGCSENHGFILTCFRYRLVSYFYFIYFFINLWPYFGSITKKKKKLKKHTKEH